MLFLTWQGSIILSERGELLELKLTNGIEEKPIRSWHRPFLTLPACHQMTWCWVRKGYCSKMVSKVSMSTKVEIVSGYSQSVILLALFCTDTREAQPTRV